ncbi:thiamine pyrophosphate-dependent enzyme [Micromonospora lupini]|uniref:thiamine pyrophosphate-binding protein n=1 Tax=Micromonospora lupini TaxID=285679 RepID=UPI0034082795
MKLHAALARALASYDVRTMFGLIGDANMFFVHSFVEDGGTYLGAAHEAGAMFMGFGYASRTGELGVVTVTHGPALTNTLTGLVEGVRARVPMLLIAGDTATGSRTNIQDIAQRDVVLPTGAGFEQARTPESALGDLAVAIRRAVVERRPVVFNIPADHMWRDIEYRDVPLDLPQPQRIGPDPEAIQRAVELISAAKRPVVLAGRGAVASRTSLLRLADRIGAPVATTLKARDLFRGDPFDLGVVGGLAGPVTRQIIDSADLLISFGASLNAYTTVKGELLSGRRGLVVDLETRVLPGLEGIMLQADAGAAAEALADALEKRSVPSSGHRTAAMAARLAGQNAPVQRPVTAAGTVDVETALRRLDDILPERRVVVSDGGRFMMESLRHIRPGDPTAFVLPLNFGSIGMGMGAAVGAAAGGPTDPVIMVCGDGGFMHGGLGEFATAVRAGLDIIVLVCNDGGYGAEHVQFVERGLDPAISLFAWPDLAIVAEALGGEGLTVRSMDDLENAAKIIADRDRPLLIDLRLDVHHMTPMPH